MKTVVHAPTCYCLHEFFETIFNMRLVISFPICKFQTHRFELTLFFSIFWKRNQNKINKAGVKLQSYSWIQSKIRRNVDEKVKTWKKRVSIFFTFYFKPSCRRPKDTNVTLMYFIRLFNKKITPERRSFFYKLHEKYCQNLRNLCGTFDIPFCDVITKIRTFLF